MIEGAFVVKRARLALAALVFLVGATSVPIASQFTSELLMTFIPTFGWACVLAGSLIAANILWRREETVSVGFSRDGVHVEGRLVLPTARIAGTRFLGRRGALQFVGPYGTVALEVAVDDEAEADELLAALELDAKRRKARFKLPLPLDRRQSVVLATILLVPILAMLAGQTLLARAALANGVEDGLRFLSFVFAITPVVAAVARGARAEVGADGVTVTHLWRKATWIPFSDVVAVDPWGYVARFTLGSGDHVDVLAGTTGADDAVNDFVGTVERALTAYRARTGDGALATLLARGGRTDDAWRAALQGLRSEVPRDGAYRTRAIRDDDLWAIVDDPGAAEESRAAAAYVLFGRDGSTEVKTRLRVSAETVAAPRLRVALQAEEDEDCLQPFVEHTARSRGQRSV